MKTLIISVMCIGLILLLPAMSQAESLANLTWTSGGGVTFQYKNLQKNTSAVEFKAQIKDDEGNYFDDGAWFQGFCVEVSQSINKGEIPNVDFVALNSVAGGLEAAWLMENRKLYQPQNTTAWKNYEIAGLQLAIWEVTHDYNSQLHFDLDSGDFKVLSAADKAKELADFYLQKLAHSFDPTGLAGKYRVAQSSSKQDLLMIVPQEIAVPEPTTILLLGLGLMGLAGWKKALRKR